MALLSSSTLMKILLISSLVSKEFLKEEHVLPDSQTTLVVSRTANLETRINRTLRRIRLLIPEVIDSVENDLFISNRNKVVISLTRFVGTVFGIINVLSNERKLQNEMINYFNITPHFTEGNKFLLFAVISVGYGYWGEYALEVEKCHVECSLYDFDRTLAEYSSVLNYKAANLDPAFGVYLTSELKNKIEENLYCLKSHSESQVVSELFVYIEIYTQLLSEKIAEVV